MTQQPLPIVNAALFKAQAAAKKTLAEGEIQCQIRVFLNGGCNKSTVD